MGSRGEGGRSSTGCANRGGAQPLPVPLGCWAFPKMDKDLTVYLNSCPRCPCQRKGEEHQSHVLFQPKHKPTKREGTWLGLETPDLGSFGFPGIVAAFSSGSSTGLEDLKQSWCEKRGLRSSCPCTGAAVPSCVCALGMAQLQLWSSSLVLRLGHPAAPLHPSCY